MTTSIPERPALPLIGHALRIPDGADGLLHAIKEAKELGPVYRIRAFGQEVTFVSGLDLVTELADETRFRKNVHADLRFVREIGGDGLFTAFNDEPNWRKAHDVLMPAFSLGAMRGYHDTMLRVARELVAKWDNVSGPVDVAEDMTRLTFDTIGLCGFGHDFESFRRADTHPFVESMSRALEHAQDMAETIPGLEFLRFRKTERFRADNALMRELVDEVVQRRRASGDTGTDDLLGRMLHTPDPVTGAVLDDDNIRHQALTFLIAGHETTSGALSFALYYLLKHPEVLARAQAEVDALWGDTDHPEPSYADVGKLAYLRQVLNESLRLWPTAPAFAREPLADTVIGGRYPVRRGETLMVLTPALHRDPAWGDNVELFDPSRFDPERERERPVHLFKPFGTGERACIGRQFALHEATLVLGLLVHRYRLVDHTDYQLRIKSTLTIKPDGFTLRLARRTDRHRPTTPVTVTVTRPTTRRATGTALTVLHGSNLGTCAAIAQDLAGAGADLGFTTSVAPLDAAVDRLPAGPVVLVAASYNGRPTDDAAEFVSWVDGLAPGSLDGVTYAVLGVGDRNWVATYQRVPTHLDERLAAAGATRLLARGEADAAGDFNGLVDGWTAELWAALLARHGVGTTAPEVSTEDGVELVDAPSSATGALAARHGVVPMAVLETRDLVDLSHPLGRPKRYLRLRLPAGTAYRTGDHLAVLPHNPEALVRRVAERFALDLDRTVTLKSRRNRLPVDRPVTLRQLLTEFVELQAPATAEQIALLAAHTACPPEQHALAATAPGADSVLDLLARNASCALPFERYLALLPVLRPRQYSISSSARARPEEVELMVSLRPGGIASSYLHEVRAGDTVHCRVLPCADAVRVPEDVPAVVVGAGTGLAPFRGAILDRLHTGSTSTLLCYFGCDHPDVDYLHREELAAAERAGVVSVRPAFTHAPDNGVKFVQDRIRREAEEVWAVLESGGRVHVCGDGQRLAPAVREAFQAVYRDRTGADETESAAWLAGLVAAGRYVEDVYTG
ncbi:cytochrome P450/NADPH-cytochrome P450 reductase [Crossiella equi]|uniref:Bifunctional cytochrome P450/NADPH--P450 reductase n=1 Tax=Crossiella equi TaxID=130796 RepID=A0ABS5AS65_9PSEU|nr:cytochrome P450 [Crossiella equi]MBP2479413.1 cytochrome P450/NADPH-cytochrome P450 reductase [Crossiella equi]